jgi:hypothetical protein
MLAAIEPNEVYKAFSPTGQVIIRIVNHVIVSA